jgi:hypothetical protein
VEKFTVLISYLTSFLHGIDFALFANGHDVGEGVADVHVLELVLAEVRAPAVEKSPGQLWILRKNAQSFSLPRILDGFGQSFEILLVVVSLKEIFWRNLI